MASDTGAFASLGEPSTQNMPAAMQQVHAIEILRSGKGLLYQ